ncbi:MAG: serine/threonine protein kinase [Labilithrix sp.]|nr:serine/threonine protein kinase [Labilithrix sp.]MCW5815533.1 serine/threonine protein kinase [Labilithrix sp.]
MATCVQCQTALEDGTPVCPVCRSLQPSRSGRGQLSKGVQIDRGYGKIVVEDKVGSGAMGTVYRGWLFYDPRGPHYDKRPVLLALKQLNPRAMVQPELRAFFQNEAEALRLLDHPNVVRFHDLFSWTPTAVGMQTPSQAIVPPILAMEFVEGDTLEDVIARNVARAQLSYGAPPGLRFDRAWYYMQQALGALAAGHALGIVHRDVKPSNILIRRDGVVKMTDYGIAHLAEPKHGERPPSPQELAPGTGAYMSPEQVLGRQLDGRSDLYSAGLVLYEAVAGRPPFLPSEKSEFALRMDQVETIPPPIRAFVPQADVAVEHCFWRALQKDPAQRFQSAIEMGDAFRSAFGIPSTPEWRALGEYAAVAREGSALEPERAQKLATLRQIVAQAYRTQPLPARPAHPPR